MKALLVVQLTLDNVASGALLKLARSHADAQRRRAGFGGADDRRLDRDVQRRLCNTMNGTRAMRDWPKWALQLCRP